MPTDAHEIEIHVGYVDWNFADCLSSITMEKDLFLPAQFADFLYILPHTNFIMHEYYTHTKHLFLRFLNSLTQEVDIQNPFFADRQVGHFESFELKIAASIQDAFMLDLSRDDVLPLPAIELGQSLQHHVVGFSGARCKYDFFGVGSDKAGHLAASSFDSL